MNHLILIAQREFRQRIKQKLFLIMTLSGPLFFSILLIVPTYFALSSVEEERVLQVLDQQHILSPTQPDSYYQLSFTDPAISFTSALMVFEKSGLAAFLYLPTEGTPVLFARSPLPPSFRAWIKTEVENSFLRQKLSSAPSFPKLEIKKLYAETHASGTSSALGILASVLIYVFILTYTMQVMRGVIEEKSNRISETMLINVKPETLMFGKILGIGLVSLVQFLIWIIIAGGVYSWFIHKYGPSLALFNNQHIQETLKMPGMNVKQALEWHQIVSEFEGIELGRMLVIFAFYFIFGYLFYSSIFAAIGASVDSETETQQFIFPLTIPILLCFTLMQNLTQEPESLLSQILSLLPFTSPVAIMMLLPSHIPLRQLILSMIVLVVSFILTGFLSGKIYRTSILLYGKKPSLKNLFRALRIKN